MKFSNVSIRILDNEESNIDILLKKITSINFEKTKYNLLCFTLDIPSIDNFEVLYKKIKEFITIHEDLFKSITNKKDIFIKIDDDLEYGNFGFDLSVDSLKYFGDLGFKLGFDIYV